MYRKINATFLFNGLQNMPEGTVLIMGAGGSIIDLIPVEDAGDGVEHYEGILCPGLINAHCHIELSHLKGRIPRNTGLCGFVEQVMRIRTTAGADMHDAMQTACSQMEEEGIVAVGDICNTDDSVALKKNSRLYWHNFIEVSGMSVLKVGPRLEAMQQVQKKFTDSLLPGNSASTSASSGISLTPHAPYSVAPELFREINRLTAKQVVSMHNQETDDENLLFKNKSGNLMNLYRRLGIDMESFSATGNSSIQSILPYLNNLQRLMLVHNCFTNREDLAFINQHVEDGFIGDVCFCLCPNANRYISGILPPVDLLREESATICLGTDSLASNEQLSLVNEMRTLQQAFPEIPLEEILQWATYNGALALELEGEKGQFKKGTRPGIVLLQTDERGLLSTGSRIG